MKEKKKGEGGADVPICKQCSLNLFRENRLSYFGLIFTRKAQNKKIQMQ